MQPQVYMEISKSNMKDAAELEMEDSEGYELHMEKRRKSFTIGVVLLLVAGAVGIFVYTGLGKDKYDIEAYNKENDKAVTKENEKVGVWCGCVMIVAAILFFVAGFVYNLWDICWIVYPVGGMICGIITLILKLGSDRK